MKPTDKNHPIEISTHNGSEPPVISRLKRVIDIKSLEPEKTKTSHHSSKTRDNNRPVSKQDAQTAHRKNQKNRDFSQTTPQKSRDTKNSVPKTSNPAPIPQHTEKTQEHSRPTPKLLSRKSDPALKIPQPDISSHAQTPIQSAKKIPDKLLPASNTNNSSETNNPQHHMRATRVIRPKGKIPRHVSESLTNTAKNRLTMKSRKNTRNALFSDSATKITSTDNLTEKIEEALLLQSWRAKQWNTCIASLDPGIQAKMLKCLPLVQAKLVNNICITAGSLEATIIDQVTSITLRQFTPGQWRSVINMLSDRAIFTTSLLNGELPEGILSVFKQASLSLFPSKLKDFSFTCTCGNESMPCEHACALLLTFALALEEDPFHILTLRGMNRDELLSQLRDARSDQVVDEKNRYRINYELPAQNVNFDEFFIPHGNFEDLNFHISVTENPLMRRLGDPNHWNATFHLDDIIAPISNMAAHEAEIMGLNENPSYCTDSTPTPKRHDESRAPKKINKNQRFTIPNLKFLYDTMPKDVLDSISGDPIDTAADIIRWLKSRGASDVRTLARRTRLHKVTIEAFLNALCQAGLVSKEGEDEHMRFIATF